MNNLLLIDGFNLLSRGYFATAYGKSEEQLLQTRDGRYTNALRVFFPKMLNLIKEHDITHLAVAWDVKREESDRRQKYDFYKATRNALPDPLIQQYHTLKDVLDAIGIIQLEIAPYEADDVIGTLASKWAHNTYIYSNDKDLLQLLSESTSQIIAQKYGEIVYYMNSFQEDYGIHPSQWVDVKALLGDTSDNIPGCPGVGEKSALPLIQQYKCIENLYENIDILDTKYNRYKKKLIAGKESTMISKELATITTSIPQLDAIEFDHLQLNIDHSIFDKKLNELELRIKK